MKRYTVGIGVAVALSLAHYVFFGSLDVSSYFLGVIQIAAVFVVNELWRGK